MSIDFATLQGLTIPEGVVTQITDASGRVLWMLSGGKVILEVEKITSNTYAGETTYTAEEFILLNIYPKTNGTVNVTYGGLTKTITDTSGAEKPNAQKVFFGTFNGVSDSVATPASGELTIEGDCAGFGTATFSYAKSSIAFLGCNITGVKSFGKLDSLAYQAFSNCQDLTEVVIPSTIKSIGVGAFGSCTGLVNVAISNGVIEIGGLAFQGCTALTTVLIPASVTTIGNNPFNNMGGKENFLVVDTDNTTYKIGGNCLLEIATNKLVSGFVNSVIPTYVKILGDQAFSGTDITDITIPDSVMEIGYSCFNSCKSLVSLTIPSGVTKIGESCFTDCTALETVTILATTPPTLKSKTLFSSSATTQIIVPKGCGETYRTAEYWSEHADKIVEAS